MDKLYRELAETHYEIHALHYRLYFKKPEGQERQEILDLIDVLEKQAFDLKGDLHL